MRIFLGLICSFALASLALGAHQEKKKEQKGAQAGQVSKPGGKGGGKPAGAGKPTGTGKPMGTGKATGAGKPAKAGKPAYAGRPAQTGNAAAAGRMSTGKGKGKGKAVTAGADSRGAHKKETEAGINDMVAEREKTTGAGKPGKVGKATGAGKPVTAGGPGGKKFQAQQFNLPNKVNPAIASTTFQANRRIEGSQNWQGSNYAAFRNYNSEWHDQGWWRQRYNRVELFGGGWYYWNAGFWFPAWGYDQANSYYPYDGPIYGYNNLPPDQVIANVQTALQQQGYYQGEVDGLLGPLTRAAIADYQRANGLAETAAIDQPTLELLGMS
jgi:hypothetical protein